MKRQAILAFPFSPQAILLVSISLAGLVSVGCRAQQKAPDQKATGAPSYTETYRPQFHFTPEENWMNDPNGLVYFDGEYHLFYQYNPFGNKWGHMSWGHAVSADLVHWQHLPVALAEQDGVMIFSGSCVVDERNTSGFGENGRPPLVAIYTGYRESDKNQAQYIAYSTDRGRSWTRYGANPVIDIGSTEFRDPKVFWHEPTRRWIMLLALAADRRIRFYASTNLKAWTHLSDFGPAGAISGVWECPDLFELPVDGDAKKTKWVLEVDLGSGALAGGSGGQYFIGSFDGTQFRLDEEIEPIGVPKGDVLADFEGASYGKWTATGDAFGGAPVRSAPDGKQQIVGAVGSGIVNTAMSGNAAQGTLTSPAFRLSRKYINFLIGGGNHPDEESVNLLVKGQAVRTATGSTGDILDWVSWDVGEFAGEEARIEIVDRNTDTWGHIIADHFVLSDAPAYSSKDRARWVDYGKDFYAVASWSNIPKEDGRHLWIAWMNNWQYGQEIPTSPWRSAQTIPREVGLKTYEGRIYLVQSPAREFERLRGTHHQLSDKVISESDDPLSAQAVTGKTLEVIAVFEPQTASDFGLKVRKGGNEETIVGYDAKSKEVFVDRLRSGNVDFNPQFSGRHAGPLAVEQGLIKLHLFVDWSSVELFANGGQTQITDRIFPASDSQGIALYARGGTARLVSLDIYELQSIWNSADKAAEARR